MPMPIMIVLPSKIICVLHTWHVRHIFIFAINADDVYSLSIISLSIISLSIYITIYLYH